MEESEKAKLYQRIVRRTPDFILLERMRVHGFWPSGQGLPPDPATELSERDQLEAKLADLRKQYTQVKDVKKALAEEHKRRMAESKARRAKRKAERLEEAAKRRAAWAARRATHIDFIGEGVGGGLPEQTSDAARLATLGLPLLHDASALASALGISIGTLRFLTYHRRGATLVHYHRYDIAKKTGGARCISAPKPALDRAQHWILESILARLPVEPYAHGFVPGRSIVTNASPHTGRKVVANLDLKDFFPSISFRRVKGLFHKMGYGGQVATLLALLCTEPPRLAADVTGKTRFYVALSDRVLPQGACTSPALTNLLCRRLDKRLAGLAVKLNFQYTRYADDLTFSGDNPEDAAKVLGIARRIVAAEGLVVHPKKTRLMRRGRRQEVTGLVVNDAPHLPRKELKQLRAILHNAARHGLASQNRDHHPDFVAYLRGRVAFACMVDPRRAPQWQAALSKALATE